VAEPLQRSLDRRGLQQRVLIIRRSIRRNVGMQDQNTHECMPLVLPFGRRRHLKPQRGDY
jgi:hypothetical protein